MSTIAAASSTPDTGAHLVDRVLPEGIPYRQWVISLPNWVRVQLAIDPALASRATGLFLRVVFAWQSWC